jgi:hypothetical protein
MNDVRALAGAIDRAYAHVDALAGGRALDFGPASDLVLDLGRARALADAIDRDHRLPFPLLGRASAYDPESLASARDRARTLADGINRADARHRALADAISRDLARDRGRGLHCDLDRDLARDRSRALADALVLARNLGQAGGLARALTDTIGQTLASDRAHSHIPALADIIDSDTVNALDAGKDPDEHRDPVIEKAPRQAGRVSPSAGRLVAVAARMLPEADRADYAEEFRGELRDLAQAGASLAGQVAYAARQLRSAPKLRVALRVAARRRAAP